MTNYELAAVLAAIGAVCQLARYLHAQGSKPDAPPFRWLTLIGHTALGAAVGMVAGQFASRYDAELAHGAAGLAGLLAHKLIDVLEREGVSALRRRLADSESGDESPRPAPTPRSRPKPTAAPVPSHSEGEPPPEHNPLGERRHLGDMYDDLRAKIARKTSRSDHGSESH